MPTLPWSNVLWFYAEVCALRCSCNLWIKHGTGCSYIKKMQHWDTNITSLWHGKLFWKLGQVFVCSLLRSNTDPLQCVAFSWASSQGTKGKHTRHPVFSSGKRVIILSLLLFGLHPPLNSVGQGMTVLRLRYLISSVMRTGLCSAFQIWHQALPYLLMQMTSYVGDGDNRLSIDRFCVRSALILLLDSFSRVGDWCGWFVGVLYFAVISQKQGAQMQFLI